MDCRMKANNKKKKKKKIELYSELTQNDFI